MIVFEIKFNKFLILVGSNPIVFMVLYFFYYSYSILKLFI